MVALGHLPPLLEAEIRYGLWAHTKSAAPAKWPPMCLRTLVRSCLAAGVSSLLELDLRNPDWTKQPAALNRVVRDMLKDVTAVHYSRSDTRDLGYIDTNYWGFRFADRRSPFDLTPISQRWLRDLTWDYLADRLDGPRRPRRQGTFEQARRSLVCFSAFLAEHDPDRGSTPATLGQATARLFVADFTRRVAEGQPALGMFNLDGSASTATPTTYSLSMNGLRRVMRWALESGAAEAVGLPREFIVAIPAGGAVSFKNPRPFSDTALRELSDPANIALLGGHGPQRRRPGRHVVDPGEMRPADQRGGRAAPRLRQRAPGPDVDVGGHDQGRQARLRHSDSPRRLRPDRGPPGQDHREVPAYARNRAHRPAAPHDRVVPQQGDQSDASSGPCRPRRSRWRFKAWIESERMRLPGHTTHQARHTLATRLVNAGASMAHVKRVLGHVSERMSDSYVLIAGSQVEPFLQQVWVTGPGNPHPGPDGDDPHRQQKGLRLNS